MKRIFQIVVSAAALFMAGCGVQQSAPGVPNSAAMGKAYGGRQPITGGVVQLWAVGTTTDGAAATPLIKSLTATTSDGTGVGGNASNAFNNFMPGYFTISGLYTCPTKTSLVYITIVGGNPGLSQGTNNSASVVMAALGQCGSLGVGTFIVVDEVTTVAAISALSSYMSAYSAIGSGSSGAAGLAAAFTLASELANTATGLSPGTNIPSGSTVPTAAINTMADTISACINSTGGVAGDSSICGNLFSATNLGAAPADVSAAMLNIANFPYSNILQLFNLDPGFAPFQPTLSTPPTSWSMALGVTTPALTLSPSPVQFAGTTLFFSTSQQVILTNSSGSSVNLTGFVLGGADQSEFSATNNCGATLAASSNCMVTVVFTPAATGVRNAGLEVDNSAGPPLYLQLSGTGLAAPNAAQVTLTPAGPVTFTAVGTQVLSLSNNGSSTINIGSIKLTGSSDFILNGNCGSTLAGNSSCAISIGATTLSQIQSATLTVVTDASASNIITVPVSSQSGTPPCTFSYTNTVKTAPVGIVAQGDTTWIQTNSTYPPNSLSSITNYLPGTFKQIGIYAYWSQIQKPDGTYDFSSIDTALCSLQAYNTANGDNVQAKLRIVPTSRVISAQNPVTASPAVALAQGGIPGGTVVLYQPQLPDAKSMAVGAYYLYGTPGDYTSMWTAMNNALGARYDANTLISEMSVETCASVDMEPWLQPSDSVSLANVASLTPPYSDKEDLNCLIHAPQAYTAWKLTPLITVTGQHNCQGDGTWFNCPNNKTEDTDTINYLTTYSNDFGARFGYEANGLRPYEVNDGETQYTSHIPGANGGPPASVALFGTNNSPVSFQPLDPNIGYSDLINTVQQGLIYCMTELELNSGAQLGGSGSTPKLTQQDLANLQSILNAGPPGNVNWNGQACKNK